MKVQKEETQHESLILCNKIVGELRQMVSVSEVKGVADKAKALQVYFRQTNESIDIQIRAAEAYLIALRRMGELLKEMSETGQRHDGKGRVSSLQSRTMIVKTLEDIGVSLNLSSECQRIASIPEEEFYKKIDDAKKIPKPPSKASLLSLADKLEGKKKPKKKKEKPTPEKEEIKREPIPEEEPISEEEASQPDLEDPFLLVLSEIEKFTLPLCDNLNALLKCREDMEEEEFILYFNQYKHFGNELFPLLSMLSNLLEEVLDVVPLLEDE